MVVEKYINQQWVSITESFFCPLQSARILESGTYLFGFLSPPLLYHVTATESE